MKKERNINLDIIRIFALFSVISVHFFLHSGFYKDNLVGTKDFILVVFREFFMICVPLFMILIGYLNNKKELSRDYYKKLIPRLTVYLIAAVCQLLVMKFYQHKSITMIYSIKTILNFGIHYGWYMNMYVGLFLLIPFLNLIYNGLKDKKEKRVLIIIFLVLTCVPTILLKTQLLFSDFWIALYPVTYYFIGCYIKEFGLKISKKLNIFLLITLLLTYGTINMIVADGSRFVKLAYNHEWSGVMPLTLAVLVFNLLLNMKFKVGEKSKKVITKISSLVFGAYLVEWIFDRIAYDFLNARVVYKNRIYYYILCVLFVFVCSLILSYIINLIVDFVKNVVRGKKHEKN